MAYASSEIEKLGNTLIYLCESLGEPISKTKAIKLLYFLEEFSIKTNGYPFLGLEWEVWHLGPVAEDLYAETNEPFMISEHIDVINLENCKGNFVVPKHEFNDDEFSDSDIQLMDLLISKKGSLTATELVDETHKPHTLWYKIAKNNNLLSAFEKKVKTTTDLKIDFSDLVNEDKKAILLSYNEQKIVKRVYGN